MSDVDFDDDIDDFEDLEELRTDIADLRKEIRTFSEQAKEAAALVQPPSEPDERAQLLQLSNTLTKLRDQLPPIPDYTPENQPITYEWLKSATQQQILEVERAGRLKDINAALKRGPGK